MQTHLQRAATVRNGLVPLAIRTETLIVTSLGEAARPPRKLAFALALYLWQLEPAPVRPWDAASARGQGTFARECARCHEPPRYSGDPVALEVIGTDPAVGLSPERTTGAYRVPSLHGVGDRRRLLSAGQVEDLRDLLDPQRAATGHPFGQALDDADRADLIAFLETL
jgi:mono/diheme cytochrome c family protein